MADNFEKIFDDKNKNGSEKQSKFAFFATGQFEEPKSTGTRREYETVLPMAKKLKKENKLIARHSEADISIKGITEKSPAQIELVEKSPKRVGMKIPLLSL